MTGQAIGLLEWLILMCLLQVRAFRVVTVQTQTRTRFRQMKVEFRFSHFTRLVGRVASIAAHVERRVPAAFFCHFQSRVVAAQAEILFLVSRNRLEQLVLVFRTMRIMAFQAIPDCRAVHRAFEVGCFLVRMAGEAKRVTSGCDQLYAGDIFVDPDLMATGAAHRHRRVDCLTFCFILVTSDAGRGIRVLVERHRMLRRRRDARQSQQKKQ